MANEPKIENGRKTAEQELWSSHLMPDGERPAPADMIFLPDAFDMLAAGIYEDWEGDEVYLFTRGDLDGTEIPPLSDAFIEDQPIAEVHAKFASAIHRHLATEATSALVEAMDQADVRRANRALDEMSSIMSRTTFTKEEWLAVQPLHNAELQRWALAEQRVQTVARLVGQLAELGAMKTLARPIGGGYVVEIDPEDWGIDDYVTRVAQSRIDPKNPFDPNATLTHYIFVDRADVERISAALAEGDSEHSEPTREMIVLEEAISGKRPKGRPVKVHPLILREWARRQERGEVLDSVTAESRYLATWFAEARSPGVAIPAPRTIEGRIRAEFTAYHNARFGDEMDEPSEIVPPRSKMAAAG